LRRAGYRLRLDPRFRGKHLKRWTVWSSIVIDVRARGIPWTQLIHRFGALANDLNTRVELRLSVVLACLLVVSIAAWALTPIAAAVTLAILLTLVGLNLRYYQWFAQQRGVMFALRVVPAHILHHLCNAVSFVVGTGLYLFGRLGLSLPGALPAGEWTPALATSESHSR
jgi:hypothetical protein